MLAAAEILPACGADSGSASKDVARLSKELGEQKRTNERLLDRVDKLERKMDGFRADVDRLSREKIAEALDIQNTVADGAGDPSASMEGDAAAAMASR